VNRETVNFAANGVAAWLMMYAPLAGIDIN